MDRYDIIQKFIDHYNYSTYLEIGVDSGENFHNRVRITHKESIDPNGNATFNMTSDEYFKSHPLTRSFDIIFIDGLHLRDQVMRDIVNSLKILNYRGVIILDDCRPITEQEQLTTPVPCRPWTGDVWKTVLDINLSRPDLFLKVIDVDHGTGIIHHLHDFGLYRRDTLQLNTTEDPYTWKYFLSNKDKILNLIEWDEYEFL